MYKRQERHCALSRTLKPVDEMIRFVVGPGDETVPDIKRKLPGRGTSRCAAWRACERARPSHAGYRAARR